MFYGGGGGGGVKYGHGVLFAWRGHSSPLEPICKNKTQIVIHYFTPYIFYK